MRLHLYFGIPRNVRIERGEGVYLYDTAGNKFLVWTSKAVCTNLGYTETFRANVSAVEM